MLLIVTFILIGILIWCWKNVDLRALFRLFNQKVATYSNNPPFIQKPLETCPKLSTLEDNWSIIKKEVENILSQNLEIPAFYKIDARQKGIADDGWKVLVLKAYGRQIAANSSLCPETTKLLKEIPQVQTAFFSILSPKTFIPKHVGQLKTVLRYHLPLIVPKNAEECFINVGGQTHVWREGRGVMFDDTFEHFVKNNTDETRVVLFLDIVRDNLPMYLRALYSTMLFFMSHSAWFSKAMKDSEPKAIKLK